MSCIVEFDSCTLNYNQRYRLQQMKQNIFAALSIAALGIIPLVHPFELKGQLTSNLFRFIYPLNENLARNIFYYLIRFKMVSNRGSVNLKGKILEAGFDEEGDNIRGLQQLGFSGVELGPSSFESSQDSFGIRIVKAKLNTYLDQFYSQDGSIQKKIAKRNERINKFKLGVEIATDEGVIQYTPYLIGRSLMKSFKSMTKCYERGDKQKIAQQPYSQIQEWKNKKYIDNRIIDFVTINEDKILSKLGQDVKSEVTKMMSQFYDEAKVLGQTTGIRIYKIEKNKHIEVYSPGKSRSGQTIQGKQLQFIGWRQILAQIIRQ